MSAKTYAKMNRDELIAECERLRLQNQKLDGLLGCAYQLAGVVGAPVRFLDAFSTYEGDIDSLLPVTLDECEGLSRDP
jgi:hypothetical protein